MSAPEFLTVRTSSRSVLVLRMKATDQAKLVARCYDDTEAATVRRALANQARRDVARERVEDVEGVPA